MKTLFTAILGLAMLVAPAAFGQSINGNAKATFQTSYTAVLGNGANGPFVASTGGKGAVSSPWITVLSQDLKTPNNWDLVITPSFEVGLFTSTTVQSKNMVQDTSTATACVKVLVLVDGVEASPGIVTYGKRTQQLTTTLEGQIAGCLSIVTNSSGGLSIVLDPACVTPELIGLTEDSMSANSFTFAIPNVSTGVHRIQVQAQISAMGDAQSGSFTAFGLLGKGTMTVESSRLVKGPEFPYVLGQ
jgi:hypothetical protein